MTDRIVNIALIEERQLFVEGIKQVLANDPTYNLYVISHDIIELDTSPATLLKMDLLLIDVKNFLTQKKKIRSYLKTYPNIKIIVLSQTENERDVTEVIKTGVDGFLIREMNINGFKEALKMVVAGSIYVYPTMTNHLVKTYRRLLNDEEADNFEYPLHLYTKRECEVLQLITDGQSNRKIAETLRISEKTVKNHVSNLLRKMKVNDRTQAVVTAIRNQWVKL